MEGQMNTMSDLEYWEGDKNSEFFPSQNEKTHASTELNETLIDANSTQEKAFGSLDSKKLAEDVAKQFINTKTMCNFKTKTLSEKNVEKEKYLQTLVEKAALLEKNQKLDQRKLLINLNELKANENMTQYTRQIADELKNYITRSEDRLEALKSSELLSDVQKTYREDTKRLGIKEEKLSKLKKQLSKTKAENDTMEVRIAKLQEEKEHWDEKLREVTKMNQEKSQRREQKIQIINAIKTDRQNQNLLKEVERIEKEINEMKQKEMENLQIQSQKNDLETELRILDEKTNFYSVRNQELEREREKKLFKNNLLRERLNYLKKQVENFETDGIDLNMLKETTILDLIDKEKELKNKEEELLKENVQLKQKNSELVHEEKKQKSELFEIEQSSEIYRCQLKKIEEELEEKNDNIKKLELEMENLLNLAQKKEEENNQKTSEMETFKTDMKKSEENSKALETEKAEKKAQLDYKQNILMPYIDKKKNDLKRNLADITREMAAKKEKLLASNTRREAYLQKLEEAHIILRKKKGLIDEPSKPEPMTVEEIEPETSKNEKTTRSILKSPMRPPAAVTPTKNVTFSGVSSAESFSSDTEHFDESKWKPSNRRLFSDED